jgi:hypothetical protein
MDPTVLEKSSQVLENGKRVLKDHKSFFIGNVNINFIDPFI